MFAFLRSTSLYILLIPTLFYVLGAAANQLVIVVNHDKFPVTINETIRARHNPGTDGMLDDIHVVASDQTHLNLLGDIFDRGNAHESIGDFGIEFAEWMFVFAPFVYMFDVTRKLRNYGR